jgi:hypothetical protein
LSHRIGAAVTMIACFAIGNFFRKFTHTMMPAAAVEAATLRGRNKMN